MRRGEWKTNGRRYPIARSTVVWKRSCLKKGSFSVKILGVERRRLTRER